MSQMRRTKSVDIFPYVPLGKLATCFTKESALRRAS